MGIERRRDYLVRQFEELGRVIAVILGFRDKNEPEKGIEYTRENFKEMLDFNPEQLLEMSDENYRKFLVEDWQLGKAGHEILGELFFQLGWLYDDLNKRNEAINCMRKVQITYEELGKADRVFSMDRERKLDLNNRYLN